MFSQFCFDNKEFYKNFINGKIANIKIENNHLREVNNVTFIIKDKLKYYTYKYIRSQTDSLLIEVGDSLVKNNFTFKADIFRKDSLILSLTDSDLCYYCK